MSAPKAMVTSEPQGAAAERDEAVRTTYLHPGRLFASAEPTAVTTVLGSCVAVCLWDPALQIGGANHYLLPHWVGNGSSSPRFGSVAIARLVDELLRLGSDRSRLQAKLFGGACVIDAFRGREMHLGEQNVQVARSLLAGLGLEIVAEDVGGHRGRKLRFHTHDGSALVKRL